MYPFFTLCVLCRVPGRQAAQLSGDRKKKGNSLLSDGTTVVVSSCSEKSLKSRLISSLCFQRWTSGWAEQPQQSTIADKTEQKPSFKCPEPALEEW